MKLPEPYRACSCRDASTGRLLGQGMPGAGPPRARRSVLKFATRRRARPTSAAGAPRIGPYRTKDECRRALITALGRLGQGGLHRGPADHAWRVPHPAVALVGIRGRAEAEHAGQLPGGDRAVLPARPRSRAPGRPARSALPRPVRGHAADQPARPGQATGAIYCAACSAARSERDGQTGLDPAAVGCPDQADPRRGAQRLKADAVPHTLPVNPAAAVKLGGKRGGRKAAPAGVDRPARRPMAPDRARSRRRSWSGPPPSAGRSWTRWRPARIRHDTPSGSTRCSTSPPTSGCAAPSWPASDGPTLTWTAAASMSARPRSTMPLSTYSRARTPTGSMRDRPGHRSRRSGPGARRSSPSGWRGAPPGRTPAACSPARTARRCGPAGPSTRRLARSTAWARPQLCRRSGSTTSGTARRRCCWPRGQSRQGHLQVARTRHECVHDGRLYRGCRGELDAAAAAAIAAYIPRRPARGLMPDRRVFSSDVR